MRKKLQLVVLGFLVFFSGSVFAAEKDSYKKGWDEFFKNNRVEARKYFNEAVNNTDTKADAYLSLCLLDWSESKVESAFENLTQFYKSSSNPEPYLYSLYSLPFAFSSSDVLEAKKVEFLESIQNAPINGSLKAMIYGSLGKHYMGCKDFDKSKEYFAKAGVLTNWQVLGAFNNISGSGFDKDWGAVAKARAEDKFENKAGASVSWFTPIANKPDGWFYMDYYYSLNSIIAYAQTFVSSPANQDVYFRIGTSGSLKIWVNDAQVASVIDERNCDLDIYSYKVKLNKGANRILLQLGQSEIRALNFMFRITDADANPIEGISHEAKYTKYTKSAGKGSNDILPFFAEEFLQNKIKQDSDNPLHAIVLAETYLRNDKAEEAILLLRQILQDAGNSSFVHYRLGEAYNRDSNPTFFTKEQENIKRIDPESFYALDQLCGEAIRSNKITEVKNLNQKIKALYGESLTTRYIDSWLANKQGNDEEKIAIAKANYEKYPYLYTYANAMFSIEEYTLKNSKAATAIIEDYCSKYFNASAMELLSGRYIKDGDTEKGLKILKDRIDIMPYASGYMHSYASTLLRMQRYQEALDMTDRIMKVTPYLPSTYTLKAEIYKAMKNEKAAIDNYNKSLYYNPTLFESRTQLRQLDNKKEMEDLFPRYSLDSLISTAGTSTDYPDDPSILLLYDTKMMFHPEGASEYHVDMAAKILNQTGIEMWKEYQIPVYGNQNLTLDKAEIIKPNGQKIKAETNGYSHIVFTNLEVNDVLYMEYRIKDYSSDVYSKHFADQYVFQYTMPTKVISYSILAPKDKKFEYTVSKKKIDPIISTVEGMKLYRWVLNDQPAIKIEPYMGSLIDISPTLSFSSIPDWNFIGNWYRDLTANKFKDDYLLKETIDQILKGKENASHLEKAKLFYEFILKNITYSNVPFMQNNYIPQKASRTISTRLGDCKDVSTLFTAMCRKVGIEANLVLIITRDNGRNFLPLPSNRFNHCIAQLKADGKTYYLELTDNKLGFGSALEADLHSSIVPIPYGNETPTNKVLSMDMPFRTANSLKRTTTMAFNNNDVVSTTQTVRSGSSASYLRQMYADLGKEDQLKELSQLIASDYNTPIKITELEFDDLNSLADTAVYKYTIDAKNIVQEIAGMKIFKIKWADNISSLEEFSIEDRKCPFDLWKYMMEDSNGEEFIITLPEGRKMVEVPKDVHLECANASYDLKYDAQTPGILKVYRSMKRKSEIITVEEYNAFKDFIHSVSEYDNKQYAII